MNVSIVEDPGLGDVEVVVRCAKVDRRVLDLLARLRIADLKLTGYVGDEARIVPASDVLYVESVDKRTFFCTADQTLETRLRLYEMERLLEDAEFVRASKSCLVNFSKVTSVRPDLGGRLLVRLESGDLVQVSRQYASDIKRKLGL